MAFHHEALMYAGREEFLAGTVPFVREGMAAREPILAVLRPGQTGWLRAALGHSASAVTFADMEPLGTNPARIIPAWQDFVDAHAGRPLRGIGEPAWGGRNRHELVECGRHEALLNLAFADAAAFRLLCPYDTEGLAPEVVADAHRTHPHVRVGGILGASRDFCALEAVSTPFADPLPEPADPATLAFDRTGLAAVRAFVGELADHAGLARARIDDLVLAASELAGNSIRHAGGHGVVRVWREGDTLLCEVADGGRILDPLVGRRRPAPGQLGGYGVWLANQLCDLVQVRTFASGGVVRLHVRVPQPMTSAT